MESLFFRAFAVGLLIAFGEVINGNVRVRYLHRRYGKARAKKISFFSGLLIIYSIAWWLLPWVSPSSLQECFVVGALWMVMLLCLDLYYGRYVFRFKWQKIVDDFNPAKGNWMLFGMILLLLCPSILFWLETL